MYCKSCGKVISDGMNYCSDCAEYVPSVGMTDAVKLLFSNYANFRGRARRSEYWKVYLFNMLLSCLCVALVFISPEVGAIAYIAMMIWCLVILVPGLALAVRRLHDIGNSGWCIFCSLIPVVGGILVFVWMCTDSREDNQWGPNPKYRPVRRAIPKPTPTPAPPQAAVPTPKPANVPDDIPMTALPSAQRMPGTPPAPPKPQPAGFSATLLLCTGPMAGMQIACRPGDRVVLGRSKSGASHVLTGYDKVSGTHCRIEAKGNSVTVTDLGSTNGTKVGSQKLTPNVPVNVPHGGIIFLADQNCAFQVKYN